MNAVYPLIQNMKELKTAIGRIFTISIFLLMLQGIEPAAAQVTVVSGTITDAKTHQVLPAVSVSFPGTPTGTSADLGGRYNLKSSSNKVTPIQFSFIGYKTVVRNVELGKTQTINVAMTTDSRMLGAVTIKAAKKQNPGTRITRR